MKLLRNLNCSRKRYWCLLVCCAVSIALSTFPYTRQQMAQVISGLADDENANPQAPIAVESEAPPFSKDELYKIKAQIIDECRDFVSAKENLEA